MSSTTRPSENDDVGYCVGSFVEGAKDVAAIFPPVGGREVFCGGKGEEAESARMIDITNRDN